MFKKRLSLKSFVEDVDVKINKTNTKNDGPGYYPETKRGREFYDAHAKANAPIDKTGAPEHQFKSNLKKIDDHGPPKVDAYAGDAHSNSAITAQKMDMVPRVKIREATEELTEEQFQQLDENVRKEHYHRHHRRAIDAAAELMKHLQDHGKLMQDPNYNKGYYDLYNIKNIAGNVEDAALQMGTHVENDKAYVANQNKLVGMRESINEEVKPEKGKYRSSSFTIRDILRK